MMRQKVPDRKNAQSIIDAAERDLKFTLTLPISEQSAATIVRNIYEGFRMLGDALLVIKGIQSQDHVTPIKELLQLSVSTPRPIQLIDYLRNMRHNINYYGYKPSLEEVKDTISLAQSCFQPLLEKVMEEI